MSTEVERWLSADDLARLGKAGVPGIPSTPRGCTIKAVRDKWPVKQVAGKGGRGGVKSVYRVPDTLNVSIDAIGVEACSCQDVQAFTYESSAAAPIDRRAHMVAEHSAAKRGPVNGTLMANCIRACQVVHGSEFASLDVAVQSGYASDLYNQIDQMAAPLGRSVNDASRLDVAGLADLLRLLLKMGWARRFPDRRQGAPVHRMF
jgi:hypothetical protein